jgi:hypothetical protein
LIESFVVRPLPPFAKYKEIKNKYKQIGFPICFGRLFSIHQLPLPQKHLRHLFTTMADLGWLLDLLKVGGGGVVGIAGKTLTDRNKKRLMRRHLCKEMAVSYGTLRGYIRHTWNLTRPEGGLHGTKADADEEGQQIIRALPTQYHQLAKSDLNTFMSLKESYAIDKVYEYLGEDREQIGAYFMAYGYCYSFERLIHSKTLSYRLVKRVADERTMQILDEQLEYGEEYMTQLAFPHELEWRIINGRDEARTTSRDLSEE